MLKVVSILIFTDV